MGLKLDAAIIYLFRAPAQLIGPMFTNDYTITVMDDDRRPDFYTSAFSAEEAAGKMMLSDWPFRNNKILEVRESNGESVETVYMDPEQAQTLESARETIRRHNHEQIH